ncbi:Tubulin-tyrosine ligase family protein [Trichomonas vaginalis G3]|uniref:Tubulin-tyrosine ligase family protein n=1 Tax=Trichomonas vaginalis (strain ATCC PRA-98 / G3) TaxID=412133 RepID=A2FPF0_TRIV3|nr:positive regulation of cilium movement [Trichomonas vaginalis G3]EAX93223.1 Tubulin-tyrosine ligase family protein [Trichomonas vaginalis G3]KAI5539465.1 positive regulation of cilium movement [Trichomonas vaginalis G3]|eukprot:XP_001306153.1 Tubulin-tyrosine ligase family protein [Trichomonas vaginalis G3]
MSVDGEKVELNLTMYCLCVHVPDSRFPSVRMAIKDAEYMLKSNDSTVILIWHDTIKDVDFFSSLLPWQIVNRIPNMNYLCRKAPYVYGVQKIMPFFPGVFTFLPQSFVLPMQEAAFVEAFDSQNKKFIIKPDGGSFGRGITILNPGQTYVPQKGLAVAQEYIESYLLDEKKFDFRIYVLIASVTPLKIYIYRDGVARFCSEKYSANSVYSQLTNVALNKGRPGVDMAKISQLISDVLPIMAARGVDVDLLWKKIDRAITLAVISSYGSLVRGERRRCPGKAYPRCFQMLGFDVLFDKNLNPWILEVNYRPSLKFYRGRERRMKVGMIKDVLRIACPLQAAQAALLARRWGWTEETWTTFVEENPDVLAACKMSRKEAVKNSKFVKTFPPKEQENMIYHDILKKVLELPEDQIEDPELGKDGWKNRFEDVGPDN